MLSVVFDFNPHVLNFCLSQISLASKCALFSRGLLGYTGIHDYCLIFPNQNGIII
jgi:hypothetical protein